jgi:hypothetical protein
MRRGVASHSRLVAAAAVTPLVVLATVLQLVRQHAVSAWDTVWAEDGYVFLTEAVNEPILRTIVGAELVVPAALAVGLAIQLAAVALAGESPQALSGLNSSSSTGIFASRPKLRR